MRRESWTVQNGPHVEAVLALACEEDQEVAIKDDAGLVHVYRAVVYSGERRLYYVGIDPFSD